jgi:hypothetical protein
MKKLVLLCASVLFGSACLPDADFDDELDDEASAESVDALAVDPEVPIAPNLNQNSANVLGEVSGIVATPSYPGFVWMHRDGFAADRPSRERLYAMKVVDRQLVAFNGSSGTYPTREFTFASGITMENLNWEDIALGTNVATNSGTSLYIGDIGNNSGGRTSYKIYQIAEPNPAGSSSVVPALQATWKFKYPSSAQLANGKWPNCETMFHLDRNLYIVTKESQPRVYRFPASFHSQPSVTHTLVPVVNGSVTRVVGAGGNPSFASFSSDHTRFMIGSHKKFFVYEIANSALTGDALVRAAMLTQGNPPEWNHEISDTSEYPNLNTEGGSYQIGSKDLLFVTEGKMAFHWPEANTESP